MSNLANKPILITGTHHSGSTYVGKTIALSPQVIYLDEPFHAYQNKKRLCNIKLNKLFYCITTNNEGLFHYQVNRMLNFRYNYFEALKEIYQARPISNMKPVLMRNLKEAFDFT